MVKAAVGGHFLEDVAFVFPGQRFGRSIACYGGQIYITEIPDAIFVDKNRHEIIKFIVGSGKR
jgi:hypothetical protein